MKAYSIKRFLFILTAFLFLPAYTFKTQTLIEENSMRCSNKSYYYVNPESPSENCEIDFKKKKFKCSDDKLSPAFDFLISICKFKRKDLESFTEKFGFLGKYQIALQDHGKSEIFFDGGAAFWEENLKPSRIKIENNSFLFYSWQHALSRGKAPGEILYPDKRWLILKNTTTK